MLAVFAEQLSGAYAVFQHQYPVVTASTSVLFSEQFIGGLAVFRDQFAQVTIPKTQAIFAEQFNGSVAVFRNQFWFDDSEIPVPVPTKIAMRVLSSGKVLLVNGRILIHQT